MRNLANYLVLISLLFCGSCTQQNPSQTTPVSSDERARVNALTEEIKQLRDANRELLAKVEKQSSAVEALKVTMNTFDTRIEKVRDQVWLQTNTLRMLADFVSEQSDKQQVALSNLAWQVIMLDLKSLDNDEAVFDAANSTGFSRINSGSGFFLVSLKNAEPYLDGYRVTLEIGNPLSASYEGLVFNVSWGRKFDPKEYLTDVKAHQKWQKGLHSKEISSADKLLPGAWNKIQLVLSPAKSDELGHIGLKFTTKTVSLRTPLDR